MKIAVALFGTRVAPRLAFSEALLIANIEDGKVTALENLPVSGLAPAQLVQLLGEQEVSTAICGGLSEFGAGMLAAHGIAVIPGVLGEANEALARYAAGQLRTGQCLPRKGRGRGLGRRGRGRGFGRGLGPGPLW